MRNPKRIDKFCNELADIWKLVPDWRFGQFIINVWGHIQHKCGDPWFLEEDEFIEALKTYFSDDKGENGTDTK